MGRDRISVSRADFKRSSWRCYRQQYNAEQALAEFANLARQETDLEALSRQLVGIVQETFQPQQVSIWLRERPSSLGGWS
jgi:IS30 family transposase